MFTKRAGVHLPKWFGALTLLVTTGASAVIPASAQEKAPEAAKKALEPAFKSAWKIDLPAETKRVAVAEITGDGKPRLLVLGADDTLTIHKIADGKPEKEASVALGKDAAKFVVGRFAKGSPPILVAPCGTFYWDKDKDKLVQKPATDAQGIYASVRMTDGSESFMVFQKDAPPAMYSIDLSKEKIFQPSADLPQPMAEGGSIREISVEFPRDFFEGEGFPDEVKKGGIARICDPRMTGKLYGLFAWQSAEGSYAALIGGGSLFPQPQADAKPLWKSPKLAGGILDIALGTNMKDAKQTGFYVLQKSGAEGKERVLEFFVLD